MKILVLEMRVKVLTGDLRCRTNIEFGHHMSSDIQEFCEVRTNSQVTQNFHSQVGSAVRTIERAVRIRDTHPFFTFRNTQFDFFTNFVRMTMC